MLAHESVEHNDNDAPPPSSARGAERNAEPAQHSSGAQVPTGSADLAQEGEDPGSGTPGDESSDDAATTSSHPDGANAPDSHAASDTAGADGDSTRQEQPAATVEPHAHPDADGHLWFAVVAGSRLGPFSTEDIRRRVRNSDLRPRHFVWRLGFGPHWYRLREVPEFRRELEQLAPEATIGPAALAERILCTNCYARVLPAWHECPTCGHRLKQEPPSAPQLLARDVAARVLGLVGAVLMLAALVLPWVQGEAARVAGLEVYLGSSFALLAGVLGFFAAQAALGKVSRPVLNLALGLWGLALLGLFFVEAHAEAAPILAQLDGAAASQVEGAGGLTVLGVGAWLYLAGLLLLLAGLTLPAVHALLQRPVPGAAVVAAVLLGALLHLQLINGNLYAPWLEVRLALQGYDVVSLERVETPSVDAAPATAPPTPETSTRGEPGHGATAHTYRILARPRDGEGRLYRAELTVPLGSLFPARTIPLQRIPLEDQPLFEHPLQESASTSEKSEPTGNDPHP